MSTPTPHATPVSTWSTCWAVRLDTRNISLTQSCPIYKWHWWQGPVDLKRTKVG